jgi:4-hydroxy-3-methylbut-2-enyl diphosphate reductase
VDEAWLEGKRVVGISSGASAPEELVDALVALFRDRGVESVEEFEVVREDVRFMLPKRLRQDLAAAATS